MKRSLIRLGCVSVRKEYGKAESGNEMDGDQSPVPGAEFRRI